MPVIKRPSPTENYLQFDELYYRFDKKHDCIITGQWNVADLAVLSLEQMIQLRRYLDDKIMKIKVDQLKELKSPF